MNSRRALKPALPLLCLYHALFVSILFFVSSCGEKHKENRDHTAYFDKVFATADGISNVDVTQALAYVDSVYRAFPDASTRDIYRKYDFKASYYLEDIDGHNDAMVHIDSMFWILGAHVQEAAYAREYGNALLKKGNLLMVVRDYADAFEYNYKARQAIEKINDSCLLSSYTLMLAAVCFKQERFLQAARYDIEAINEARTCPKDYRLFRMMQGRLDDIGFAFVRSKMPDSALIYFNKALDYLEQNKDSFPEVPNVGLFVEVAKGVVYGNMGDAYLQLGDTVSAEKCYKQDRNIYGEPGFDRGDGRCTQLKIASLYLALNKLPEADRTLLALRGALDSFSWVDDELKWLRLKVKFLEVTNQTDKAFPYMKAYQRIRDSLAALKPVPQVDLVKGYEQVRDRYEVTLLESENQRKNYYLAIVLGSSLLAIIIAMILWFYWRQSKKMNDAITRRNNEIIKRNNEMKLALTSLTESEKRNTRLMQIVAHDLKNPVASIISIASIILDNKNVNEEDQELLELMKTSGERSIEMISNILNINNDAGMLVKEPTEIHDLLRYCIDLLQFKASEKGQYITLDTREATISINKEKMWRVISNLIVNAIKFSPDGTEIAILGRKKENTFLIEVRDRGIGIPGELQGKIFDMFTDARRPGTQGEQSFGLGLAISRQIVEAHGGRLWCESEADKGTSFFISLPL